MAYDPEAREQSNSAMIIAVVALVIIVLGALAWYATRPTETPVVVSQPTVERHTETITEVPVPTNDAPDTVVVQPSNPAPAPSTSTETQVTVNPPASTPPADSSATSSGTTTPEAAPPGDGTSSSSGY